MRKRLSKLLVTDFLLLRYSSQGKNGFSALKSGKSLYLNLKKKSFRHNSLVFIVDKQSPLFCACFFKFSVSIKNKKNMYEKREWFIDNRNDRVVEPKKFHFSFLRTNISATESSSPKLKKLN